jgi:hypothetical protein
MDSHFEPYHSQGSLTPLSLRGADVTQTVKRKSKTKKKKNYELRTKPTYSTRI